MLTRALVRPSASCLGAVAEAAPSFCSPDSPRPPRAETPWPVVLAGCCSCVLPVSQPPRDSQSAHWSLRKTH